MIKRYKNRRLYWTEINDYVTLEKVRKELLAGEPVLSATTYIDVTAEVLVSLVRWDTGRGSGPTCEQLREFIKKYTANVCVTQGTRKANIQRNED